MIRFASFALFLSLLLAACGAEKNGNPNTQGSAEQNNATLVGTWVAPWKFTNMATVRYQFNADGTFSYYSQTQASENAPPLVTLEGKGTYTLENSIAFRSRNGEFEGFPLTLNFSERSTNGVGIGPKTNKHVVAFVPGGFQLSFLSSEFPKPGDLVMLDTAIFAKE